MLKRSYIRHAVGGG